MRACSTIAAALLLGVMAGIGFAADGTPEDKKAPTDLAGLKAGLMEILTETKMPGISVALVSRDEVLLAEGFGLADVEKKLPATADTLFRIGSTAKAFTALAALKLRAEGKLDFNATLASLAPDVEFKNPWEATHPVRIVHLMEHTAGFDDIHLRDYANSDPRPNNLKDALGYDPDSRTSRWPPGERMSYCNAGPPVVAYVIEKITGEVFEDYVQRNFFEPIGMTTASYFPPAAGGPQLTQLYKDDGVTAYPYWHISIRPSGAINASARDMAAYVRFHLNRGRVNGRELVSEADVLRMETPATTLGARAGLTAGYGLYNGTSFDDNGFVWHGHSGGVLGGGSLMGYMPEAGLGYAFMFNAANGEAVTRIAKLIQAYLTHGLAKPAPPAEVLIDAQTAERFDGFYVPVNPRSEMGAVVGPLSGVQRLSFSDGAARFGPLVGGETRRYVGFSPGVLRREDRALAQLALIDTGEHAVVAAGSTILHKRPALLALGPPALALFAALMALSTVLFVPVWAFRAWRGKIQLRPHLGLRLWPLAAALTLAAFLAGPVLMFTDDHIFENYGSVTLHSLTLVVLSVLALVLPWFALTGFLRGRYAGAHRGLYWHAALVLVAIGALALYLAAAGAIPFITWT